MPTSFKNLRRSHSFEAMEARKLFAADLFGAAELAIGATAEVAPSPIRGQIMDVAKPNPEDDDPIGPIGPVVQIVKELIPEAALSGGEGEAEAGNDKLGNFVIQRLMSDMQNAEVVGSDSADADDSDIDDLIDKLACISNHPNDPEVCTEETEEDTSAATTPEDVVLRDLFIETTKAEETKLGNFEIQDLMSRYGAASGEDDTVDDLIAKLACISNHPNDPEVCEDKEETNSPENPESNAGDSEVDDLIDKLVCISNHPNDPEVCDDTEETSALIPGDADGDGDVDFTDFLTVSANYGKSNVGLAQGDFTGDNKVDFGDFLIVSNNYGTDHAAVDAMLAVPTA